MRVNPNRDSYPSSNIAVDRYGLMYLVLTSIPGIFEGVYHESIGIVGLHYISLSIGFSIAAQFNSRFIDKVYIYLRDKNGGIGKPEFRLREFFCRM